MKTFPKTTLIFISGFLLLLTTAIISQADAQNRYRASGDTTVSEQERDVRPQRGVQRGAQRGINQPRENRLVHQLDGITEEQMVRIDELSEKHREAMSALLERRNNNELARGEFLAERRTHMVRHEEELKEVLTQSQWEQLLELRADRRRQRQPRQ